jgi:hypothetical protein
MLNEMLLILSAAGGAAEPGGQALAESLEQVGGSLVVIAILALALCARLGVVGMALLFQTTRPGAAERTADIYETKSKRCVLIGLVNLVGGLLLAGILANIPLLRLFGVVLFLALVTLSVLGYHAAYRSVGKRLGEPEAPPAPVRDTVLGALVLEGAFLVPLIGQLLCLYVLLRGLGAIVIALISGRRKPAETKTRPAAES